MYHSENSFTTSQNTFRSLLDGPCIIDVEGNIGVGKSTITARLAARHGAVLFSEPVAKNPYLERFYQDPPRYAFSLQMWILRQRFCTYVAAIRRMMTENCVVILDRSIFSDFVFANNSYEEQQMTAQEFAVYLTCRQQMLEVLPPPSIILYLDASPETCLERITCLRRRQCESSIPLAYLQGLERNYKRWMATRKAGNVVSINWSVFQPVDTLEGVLMSTPADSRFDNAQCNHEYMMLLSDQAILEEAMTVNFNNPQTRQNALIHLRSLDAQTGDDNADLNALLSVGDVGPNVVDFGDEAAWGRVENEQLNQLARGMTA